MARRVLLILPDLRNPQFKGGIQVFNNYLVAALRRLGFELRIISVNDRAQDASPEMPELIPCNRGRHVRKAIAAAQLFRQAMAFRPEFILCGHLNFTPVCAAASRLLKIPFITITHGVELWNPPANLLRTLAAGARIISVSRYTRGLVLEKLPGFPPERAVVFQNTFDPDVFVPREKSPELMSELGLSRDDKVILTICRLAQSEQLKGYDKVIRVLPEVLRAVPEARYVLGGRGDDVPRIEGLISELGLEGRVIMPGFVSADRLVDFFNLADVFVMPSKKEGFGIVFLEAMSCGKPVIAGNKDGSMDAVQDGKLGIAIDPDDPAALREAIITVLTGKGEARLYDPQRIRRDVIEAFGFEGFVRRLGEILADIAAPRHSSAAKAGRA